MRSNEIAKLTGVTVRALRHYHAIGLLPEPPRGQNGYRDYGAEELVRLLRIKRLSSLGFSLSRIGDVLDEMDANLEEATAPSADASLDELDRELASQIEHLQEQRRTIALLKSERLDPDLPVRFARAAKELMGDAYASIPARSGDREALLITGHLYTENETAELERTVEALRDRGLLNTIHQMQSRFDNLSADTPHKEIDCMVDETLDSLDPIIDCFDPANWESEWDAQAEAFIDEVLRYGLNEAQRYATGRVEKGLKERILGRMNGSTAHNSSTDDAKPLDPDATS